LFQFLSFGLQIKKGTIIQAQAQKERNESSYICILPEYCIETQSQVK